MNFGFVLLLLGVPHGSVTAPLEPREAYSSLPVLKGFVSLSGVCVLVQVVWKGSSSSRTQLLSKAALISFPPICSVYFCTLLLLCLIFPSLPNVLTEGCAVLSWPLPPAPQLAF